MTFILLLTYLYTGIDGGSFCWQCQNQPNDYSKSESDFGQFTYEGLSRVVV